jgi:hypothetical protein
MIRILNKIKDMELKCKLGLITLAECKEAISKLEFELMSYD